MPYDEVFELEDINSEFGEAEASPMSSVRTTSPIQKPPRPIKKIRRSTGYRSSTSKKAKTVLFIKRGMGSGYAGVENERTFREQHVDAVRRRQEDHRRDREGHGAFPGAAAAETAMRGVIFWSAAAAAALYAFADCCCSSSLLGVLYTRIDRRRDSRPSPPFPLRRRRPPGRGAAARLSCAGARRLSRSCICKATATRWRARRRASARSQNRGYSVLGTAFRGYPGSTGAPTEAGLTLDLAAMNDDGERRSGPSIVPLGRSLGSGLAVKLARRQPVAPSFSRPPIPRCAVAQKRSRSIPRASCCGIPIYPWIASER